MIYSSKGPFQWFMKLNFKVLKMDLYMQYIFLHRRSQCHTNSATFGDTVNIYISMRNKLLLQKSQEYDTISIILYRFWNILLRILQIQNIEHKTLYSIVCFIMECINWLCLCTHNYKISIQLQYITLQWKCFQL